MWTLSRAFYVQSDFYCIAIAQKPCEAEQVFAMAV